jgi:hypothetical protein
MGARRRAGKAGIVAALLCAGARSAASVQVEPIARLSLEGGYDSNVLYDGRGGDNLGRFSPDLALQLRDHTWSLGLQGGGDLLMYERRRSTPVWNQRGSLDLRARLDPRLTLESDLSAIYAPDPVGLARLGIFGRTGAALIGSGSARVSWRADHDWQVAGTLSEHVVRFDDGTGAASHEPGVEATKRFHERLDVGGAYRLDVFQGFGPASQDGLAHEVQAVARYRWTRHVTLEAEAGPAFWISGAGQGFQVLPQAAVQLVALGRRGDALRLTARHGVGLGNLATPGLFDSAEAAFTVRLGRSFLAHADGGLWRSGQIPWGANGVIGYGLEGEIAWLLGNGLRLGLAASRFARADTTVTTFNRNVVGLRLGWELRRRQGRD